MTDYEKLAKKFGGRPVNKQTAIATIDIPGVFGQAPRDFVPKRFSDIVDQEVSRINVRMSGFRAWFNTVGACYRADYFVAMTNMLKQYCGLMDAQAFAQHAQANLARVHKDIQFDDQYKDADQRKALLQRISEVQAAQAAADFTYQELQMGHELKSAEVLMKMQNYQVEHAIAHEAWQQKIPKDTYVKEQEKRRMDQAEHERRRAELKLDIEMNIELSMAEYLQGENAVERLVKAYTTVEEIKSSTEKPAIKDAQLRAMAIWIGRLEKVVAGQKDD